jgi:hypothetical protein
MGDVDSDWPPASGLGTPTVPREQATLVISASTTINAPASVVFDVVCESANYAKWNSQCPSVVVHHQPSGAPANSTTLVKGTSFTFNVLMDVKKPNKVQPTQLVVTDISTPQQPSDYIPADTLSSDPSYTSDLKTLYRISWKSEGGFVSRGLRTERFHEIIVKGKDECQVRTWEVMGGPLASMVKWLYQTTLRKFFIEWCEELKKTSEEKATTLT